MVVGNFFYMNFFREQKLCMNFILLVCNNFFALCRHVRFLFLLQKYNPNPLKNKIVRPLFRDIFKIYQKTHAPPQQHAARAT